MRRQTEKRSSFGDFLEDLAKENGFSLNLTPGQMLRSNRERFGMTLKDLAAVTGIKEPNLSTLENDKSPMTPYYADIFSAAFDVPAPAFLYPNGKAAQSEELEKIKTRMKKFIRETRGLKTPRTQPKKRKTG